MTTDTAAELTAAVADLRDIVAEATADAANVPKPAANTPDQVADAKTDEAPADFLAELRAAGTGPTPPDVEAIQLVAVESIQKLRQLALAGSLELKAMDKALAVMERLLPLLLTAAVV